MALASFISDAAELAEFLHGLLVTAEHMVWAPPEQLDRDAARASGFQPLPDDQGLIIDA